MTPVQHYHAPDLDTRRITIEWLAALCALGSYYLGGATWGAEDERPGRKWLAAQGVETEGCSAPVDSGSLATFWGGRLLSEAP